MTRARRANGGASGLRGRSCRLQARVKLAANPSAPPMKPASVRYGASGCSAAGDAVDLLDEHAARRVAAGAGRARSSSARAMARAALERRARRPEETRAAADRRATDRRRARRRRGSPSRRRAWARARQAAAVAGSSARSAGADRESAVEAGYFKVAPYGFAGSVAASHDLGVPPAPVAQRSQEVERAGQRELRRAEAGDEVAAPDAAGYPPSLSAPDRPMPKPPG